MNAKGAKWQQRNAAPNGAFAQPSRRRVRSFSAHASLRMPAGQIGGVVSTLHSASSVPNRRDKNFVVFSNACKITSAALRLGQRKQIRRHPRQMRIFSPFWRRNFTRFSALGPNAVAGLTRACGFRATIDGNNNAALTNLAMIAR
jgi:hypothetical protein